MRGNGCHGKVYSRCFFSAGEQHTDACRGKVHACRGKVHTYTQLDRSLRECDWFMIRYDAHVASVTEPTVSGNCNADGIFRRRMPVLYLITVI